MKVDEKSGLCAGKSGKLLVQEHIIAESSKRLEKLTQARKKFNFFLRARLFILDILRAVVYSSSGYFHYYRVWLIIICHLNNPHVLSQIKRNLKTWTLTYYFRDTNCPDSLNRDNHRSNLAPRWTGCTIISILFDIGGGLLR